MDEQWLGRSCDLNCGVIGVFQGIIGGIHLEEQTITIKNVIHNGVPSKMSSVTIEARDIKEIGFVDTPTSAGSQSSKQATSTVTTVAKKKVRPVAENLAVSTVTNQFRNLAGNTVTNQSRKYQQSPFDAKKDQTGSRTHHLQQQEAATVASSRYNRDSQNSRNAPRQRHTQRNDDCFDIDMGNMHTKEFDFEHNLALFDKRSVLEEIESNQPDVVRLIDHNRKGGASGSSGTKTKVASATTGSVPKSKGFAAFMAAAASNVPPPPPKTEPKYRNDQNVIAAQPTQYHLISLEEAPMGEYKTDTGLVVPAISAKLRDRFMAAAEAKGISRERLVELVARAGFEIASILLGGSRRLNPQNRHQAPFCMVFCGPGKTGEYGLAISRHLASQGVKTSAFFPKLELYQHNLANEFELYKLCCKGGSNLAKLVQDVKLLPSCTVDLIIMALDDHDLWQQERSQPWHRGVVSWCKEQRCPILGIDPLASPISQPITFKASLIPGLPLWHDGSHTGKIHMVNLAVPAKVYKDVGITYQSPFGAKSFITLDPVV